MPIHLITGLPGDGKTTTMVHLLAKAAKEAKRPLFQWGIDGLKPGFATELADPKDWNKQNEDGSYVVPDGALIFIDEAWKSFGHLQNATRQQTPAHVLALAEHRHRGLDFVWTTQAPAQIYPFARTLIGEHWHVLRKFGTSMQEIYKWNELQEDVKSQSARERAVKEITSLKTDTFDLFKSASEHTIKARIPWKVWALPALIIIAGLLLWWAFLLLRPEAMAVEVPDAGSPGLPGDPQGSSTASPGRRDKIETLEEYLARLAMRAPGLHGSQPIFDGRDAQAEPRTFCVMSGGDAGDESCNCYTEQATKLFDVRDDVCRHMARWGGYDPFLAPMEGREGELLQPEQPQRRAATGIRGEPGMVGNDRMGEVWGKSPATLRASGGGG